MRYDRLTTEELPLLLSAGFKVEGPWVSSSLMWKKDKEGYDWQAVFDESEYIHFIQHDKDMRRMPYTTLTFQRFYELFGDQGK